MHCIFFRAMLNWAHGQHKLLPQWTLMEQLIWSASIVEEGNFANAKPGTHYPLTPPEPQCYFTAGLPFIQTCNWSGTTYWLQTGKGNLTLMQTCSTAQTETLPHKTGELVKIYIFLLRSRWGWIRQEVECPRLAKVIPSFILSSFAFAWLANWDVWVIVQPHACSERDYNLMFHFSEKESSIQMENYLGLSHR